MVLARTRTENVLENGHEAIRPDLISLRRQMEFGLGTARRGWLEPRHVLNTRSVADVRAFVARKRSR